MQFSPDLFSPILLQAGAALAVSVLLLAAWFAPWRAVLAVPLRQHVLFGALVVLSLIWSFRYQVLPELHAHPFLVMAAMLVFGWSLTLLLGALAMVLVTTLGGHPWAALPLDWLFSVVLPASLGFGLMRSLYWLRLRNLFFYILGLGFFGTIVVTFLTCSAIAVFLVLTQSDPFLEQFWERSAFIVPLLYSEGFLNGLLVTSITVFTPNLVKTFDEHHFR